MTDRVLDGRCPSVLVGRFDGLLYCRGSNRFPSAISGEECAEPLAFFASPPPPSFQLLRHRLLSVLADQIPRRDLALVLTLEGAGLPVEGALDPHRVLDQLDVLLHYHGLEYLDSLMLEIPALKGGEVIVVSRGACCPRFAPVTGVLPVCYRFFTGGIPASCLRRDVRRCASSGYIWFRSRRKKCWVERVSDERVSTFVGRPLQGAAARPGAMPGTPLTGWIRSYGRCHFRELSETRLVRVYLFPVTIARLGARIPFLLSSFPRSYGSRPICS